MTKTKVFLFDTETTGLPVTPVDTQPTDVQPYVTQLHGLLVEYDDNGHNVIKTMSKYISDAHHDGVRISKKITQITGISNDTIKDAPRWSDIRHEFHDLASSADIVCSHNFPFDARMVWIQEKRLGFSRPFSGVKHRCTLKKSREIYKDAKSKALGNLYTHLFGEELTNAHTADADTNALLRIYMRIVADGAW